MRWREAAWDGARGLTVARRCGRANGDRLSTMALTLTPTLTLVMMTLTAIWTLT